MRIDSVQTSTQLGERLIAGARKDGLGGITAAEKRALMRVGHVGRAIVSPLGAVAAAAQALGVPAETAEVVTTFNRLMERAAALTLRQALALLEADAQIRGRRMVIAIDEVQDIGAWGEDGREVEAALEGAARRPNRQLRFAFAGSERHALETLFSEGRPLRVLSDRLVLPPISRSDWHDGLRDRFAQLQLRIEEAAVDALLDASARHALCTMFAAKETALACVATGSDAAGVVHVETALAAARGQVWWSDFTEAA